MDHYSEMNFLFSNATNRDNVNSLLNNVNNKYSIFDTDGTKYVVYKSKNDSGAGTNNIKNYLSNNVYKNEDKGTNPYVQMIMDFDKTQGQPGAGLRIKAADLAYLRELGVYPINRMAILRRFPEGGFVPEDLNEMKIEPISTVIGWIKPSDNFGKITFNEDWGTIDKRFDQVLAEVISKNIGLDKQIVPVGDFAQGMLFELYRRADLLERSGVDETVDETYESFDTSNLMSWKDVTETDKNNQQKASSTSTWGLNNIPVGDPNVLKKGPWRDPETQNIESSFEFTLETTYEQKLLGDVDPGSAMLDILDNIYAMGTSNMNFYWGDNAPTVAKARRAASGDGNNLNAWWDMVAEILKSFWKVISEFFVNTYKTLEQNFINQTTSDAKTENEARDAQNKKKEQEDIKNNPKSTSDQKAAAEAELKKLEKEGISSKQDSFLNNGKKKLDEAVAYIAPFLQSILTTTFTINRYKLRGSLEAMVGGKLSSTPWYLTLGNPYSPWLATNHIVITSASVESSNEMGFNDQPQRLTAIFNCKFSRPLGKQELMRMFNNTYRRTYNYPPPGTDAANSTKVKNNEATKEIQKDPLPIGIAAPVVSSQTPQMGQQTPYVNPVTKGAEVYKYMPNQSSQASQPNQYFRI